MKEEFVHHAYFLDPEYLPGVDAVASYHHLSRPSFVRLITLWAWRTGKADAAIGWWLNYEKGKPREKCERCRFFLSAAHATIVSELYNRCGPPLLRTKPGRAPFRAMYLIRMLEPIFIRWCETHPNMLPEGFTPTPSNDHA